MAQWAQRPEEKEIHSDEVPLLNCMEVHHGMNHGRRYRMFDLHREVQLEEGGAHLLYAVMQNTLQECMITDVSDNQDNVATQEISNKPI